MFKIGVKTEVSACIGSIEKSILAIRDDIKSFTKVNEGRPDDENEIISSYGNGIIAKLTEIRTTLTTIKQGR